MMGDPLAMMKGSSSSSSYKTALSGMVSGAVSFFIGGRLNVDVVCQRLLTCLDRLIAKGTNEQTTLLLLSTLDLMQGLLLIHPPSRRLFSREIHMTVFPECPCSRLIKDTA